MEVRVEENEKGEGNIMVSKILYRFADTMALKCAVELRIPDIIHSHGNSISLSKIASHIESSSCDTPLNIRCLSSLMRFLAVEKIFTVEHDESGETLYGLNHSSRCLLHDSEKSLVPMIVSGSHPWMIDPWHKLSAAIKKGGTAFDMAHGKSFWEFASINPEFNNMFNNGLASRHKDQAQAILLAYKDGFQGINTIVDVGGANGSLVSEIVKANSPRLKGINFDLQHVIENAPAYHGVTHVAGDIFVSIPRADVIIMKCVLHDWGDEDCKKILRNCRQAILETNGKVILIELVLEPEDEALLNDEAVRIDLALAVYLSGGKERTQLEWTNLLKDAGFSRCKFIKTLATLSIIEAYPF